MNYLIFDTETNGLPSNYKAHYSDVDNWPRIVQLAFVVANSQGEIMEEYCQIIKPVGFTIPQGMIHGISHEQALEEGISIEQALAEFTSVLIEHDKSLTLVAHNINFDRPIVAAELCRIQDPQTARYFHTYLPQHCTMLASVNFCAIRQNGKYKWPKLQELYFRLFGEEFDGAHDAGADVRATARCFFELKKLGVIR